MKKSQKHLEADKSRYRGTHNAQLNYNFVNNVHAFTSAKPKLQFDPDLKNPDGTWQKPVLGRPKKGT